MEVPPGIFLIISICMVIDEMQKKLLVLVVPRSPLWKKLLDVGDDRFFVAPPSHIVKQVRPRTLRDDL